MMMVLVGVAEGEGEREGERVRKKARRGCRKRNDRWQLIQGQLDEVGWMMAQLVDMTVTYCQAHANLIYLVFLVPASLYLICLSSIVIEG